MCSYKSIRKFIDKHGGPMERPMKFADQMLPYHHKLIPEIQISYDLDKKFNKLNILKSSPLLSKLFENIDLVFGEQVYQVNKYVLSSMIPDFHQLLLNGYKLTSYTIDPSNFKFDSPSDLDHSISLLAQLISCKSITLTIEDANELLKISDPLQINGLSTFLLSYLKRSYDNIEIVNGFSDELSKYESLLLLLLDLSENNFDSTLFTFLHSDLFNFDQNAENTDEKARKISLFCNLVEISSNARPYSNEILAKFCSEAKKELKNEELFEELSYDNLFFIHKLLEEGVINKEKLLKSISQNTPELFCWFSPELEKYDKNKYYELLKNFKLSFSPQGKKTKKQKQKIVETPINIFDNFEKFITNIEKFYEEDWKLLRESRKSGSNQSEIAQFIRDDDVNGLQSVLKSENADRPIIHTIFERCKFIRNRQPYLIEYAAFFGSVDCFKYLLSNTDKIHNSFVYAAAGGCIEIIRICENSGASIMTGIGPAIQFSRNSIFEWILDSFDSIDSSPSKLIDTTDLFYDIDLTYGYTELSFKYGNIFALKTLIERGFDITQQCLIFASKSGNVLLAKLFFALGFLPEDSDCLLFAIENGRATVLQFILSKSIEIFKKMSMPNLLFNSINAGYANVVEVLIDSGLFDINSTDLFIKRDNYANNSNNSQFNNFTDISYNEEEEDYDYDDDVVIIKNKHSTDLTNYFNPLFSNKKEEENTNLDTPLIAAARMGNLDVLKVILKKKDEINLNAVNKDGMTALMVAVDQGKESIVKELISLIGVDLNMKKGTLTASKIASNKGFFKISSLLTKEQRNRTRMSSK